MSHVGVSLFLACVTRASSVQISLTSPSIRVDTAQNLETIPEEDSSASVSNRTLRVHTFNTALTRLNFPESFDVRRRELVTKLKELEDDVVCLQEVWDRSDMDNLSSMLREPFPYQVLGEVAEVTDADMGSCWPLPVGMVARIMLGWLRYGPDAASRDTTGIRHHPCSRCAAAYMFEAGDVKATPSTVMAAIRFCSQRRLLFPVNGSSGVMVVSRKKIEKSRETTLPHAFCHRTAIDVLIEGLWIRCTHLSIWPQENSEGMKLILDKGSPPVVLGDLNSGRADPNQFVDSYNEDSMKVISEMGFVDAVSGCTWCTERTEAGLRNELVATWDKNVTLDHILVRNASGVEVKNVRKTFTFQDFSAESENGKWFSLSDHLGVSAELTWRGSVA